MGLFGIAKALLGSVAAVGSMEVVDKGVDHLTRDSNTSPLERGVIGVAKAVGGLALAGFMYGAVGGMMDECKTALLPGHSDDDD